MDQNPRPEVYQLHVWIRQISPMIWRRFLIRSDSTLTDLHNTLQIAFGWSDFHLHRFRIRGQDYSVGQTIFTDLDINGDEVRLADFRFRLNERFLYEYDFGDWWQHEVRIERRLPLEKKRIYPVCTGGKRAEPPEEDPNQSDKIRVITHRVFSSATTSLGCVTTAVTIEPDPSVLNSTAYPGNLFSVNSAPLLGVNSNLCCP